MVNHVFFKVNKRPERCQGSAVTRNGLKREVVSNQPGFGKSAYQGKGLSGLRLMAGEEPLGPGFALSVLPLALKRHPL
jgi:hypothetical protein